MQTLSLRQFDARGRKDNLPVFIEITRGHFEGLFTHAKKAIDIFGAGLIVVRQVAFVLFCRRITLPVSSSTRW